MFHGVVPFGQTGVEYSWYNMMGELLAEGDTLYNVEEGDFFFQATNTYEEDLGVRLSWCAGLAARSTGRGSAPPQSNSAPPWNGWCSQRPGASGVGTTPGRRAACRIAAG